MSRCFRLPELAFVAASFVGLLIYFHYFVGLKQFVLCLEQVHGAGREHMEKHEVQPGLVMGLLPPSNTEAGSSLQQQYTSIIEDKAATLGDVLLDKAWREEESPDVGRVEHLAQGRVRGGSREEENGPPRELTEPHPPCSRGVQPSEHRLFCCMGFFPCRNGKGSVPCARVNDDYCDCSDGSDEPGKTYLCPASPHSPGVSLCPPVSSALLPDHR